LQDELQIYMTLMEFVEQISPDSQPNSIPKDNILSNGNIPVHPPNGTPALDTIDSLRKSLASKQEDNNSLEKTLAVCVLTNIANNRYMT